MNSVGLKAGRPSVAPVVKVRLNVEIDKTLHKKLKQRALDEDKRVADIVRDVLAKHVA